MSSFFSGGLAGCRNHFPALKDPESIICDGAAGSQVVIIIIIIIIIKILYLVKISLQCQVPSLVVEKMANHLQRFAHPIHACVCINVPDDLDFDHRLGATNVGGEYPSSCKVPFFCILQSWRDTLVLHLVKFKSGLLDPWWLSMCKQNYFFIRDGAKLFKN